MTPLVFLPGMMCDARLFGPQIATFSAQRFTACAALTAHASMEKLAQDVLRHAPPRFALAGLSMGGILAMEILRQAPDRIAGLALLDTNPLSERHETQAKRRPQIEAVRAGHLASVMREAMIPNYLAAPDPDHPISALCLDMAMSLGAQTFIRQSLALRDRPDQTAVLTKYKGPALLLCGSEDRLCPPARHIMMKDLMPQAALEILEGCGHLPTLECPNETTAAMDRWLEDL